MIEALRATECLELSARHVDSLSGGQRQRVWVPMLLVSQTSVLLRDELVAAGPPAEILDQNLMRDVFDLDSMVMPDPAVGTPMVVPLPRIRGYAGS